MASSFWRYSHLILALLSSVFLFIAAATGIILSAEPVIQQAQSPAEKAALDTLTLSDLIPKLKNEYIEVFSVEVEKEGAVKVDVIGFDEETDGAFYIHPATAKKSAEIEPKSDFFEWVTALHRSLFMHNSGRIIMGITVFLLLLMATSGIALVIKSTNGLKHIFTRLKKHNEAQYFHTVLGRWSFIPIMVMAFGGTIMFLDTQGLLEKEVPSSSVKESNNKNIFEDILLSEVVTLNFPFSSDETDFFELELHDKNLKIHQYTNSVVSDTPKSNTEQLVNLSETLHTGRGQFIWAIILGLISINLIYFMYSGTKIAWNRISSKTRNKFGAEDAEIIILVGSENGSTKKFALQLFKALISKGNTVFVDEMNAYQAYPKAKHLLVLTSTYGDGEAPFKARKFLDKVNEISQPNTLSTYVIGFGSMSYPQFCQYAIDVHEALANNRQFDLFAPPFLIDKQSFTSFKLAIDEWAKQHKISIDLPNEEDHPSQEKSNFEIVRKEIVDDGYSTTFTLSLKPLNHNKFQAGDLLAIAPPEEEHVRYYSMGKTHDGNILLSIKKHDLGKCSTYLFKQELGDKIRGIIKINKSFHLPKNNDVILIANGTGIAPFLGMNSMYTNQKKTFYLGGRTKDGFKLYHHLIQENSSKEQFNTLHFAISKEESECKYVQDLIRKHKHEVLEHLKNKGSIMICGSLKMRDGVLEELKQCVSNSNLKIENLIEKGKIKMDCY
ncbi:PepSY domain-containing protein [Brumimicrobium aurantiacum]|uniref:NADPH--hemoprotein reductase n=1 Tax=Brumimicrobium aurantiacum TaxID=1737063 RepID=A0A3E1F1P6_9FLAO|nr:PepSY domain-containing protein [Brumimicrobium aurantiacum]RFC55751.1 hypothetical protein DXU93_02105 [Brumimicrobium aurantiacum]